MSLTFSGGRRENQMDFALRRAVASCAKAEQWGTGKAAAKHSSEP